MGKDFHLPRGGGGEEGRPSTGASEGRGETAEPEKSACRGCRPGALMEQSIGAQHRLPGPWGPAQELASLVVD